jgi:hypothetical protein
MNIYLITIGTFGLIGLIRTRKNIKTMQIKEKELWQSESKIEKRKSYIDCWQEVYKTTKEHFFVNIIYNLLYMFSLCQIRYNKIVRFFHQHYKKIENIKAKVLYLDSNGKIKSDLVSDYNYTGALLFDGPNIVVYESFPATFDYKVSQVHFINVELEYNNKMYPMHLKTDNVNYYIVNNSLNAFFVKYYILNVLKIPINENEQFHYTIHIIDHNVNCITLNQVQRLIITEDGYEIE